MIDVLIRKTGESADVTGSRGRQLGWQAGSWSHGALGRDTAILGVLGSGRSASVYVRRGSEPRTCLKTRL